MKFYGRDEELAEVAKTRELSCSIVPRREAGSGWTWGVGNMVCAYNSCGQKAQIISSSTRCFVLVP